MENGIFHKFTCEKENFTISTRIANHDFTAIVGRFYIFTHEKTPFHVSRKTHCSLRFMANRGVINSSRLSDAIWRQWSWSTLARVMWPSDAIRRQRSGSTLAQVMACCLTAPSHYLKQCWLIIKGALWQSSVNNIIGIAQNINWEKLSLEISLFTIILKSPRSPWVLKLCNSLCLSYLQRGLMHPGFKDLTP